MKQILFTILFALVCAASVSAQQDEPSRFELFGGYSLRTEKRETSRDFANINGLTPAQIRAALGVDVAGNSGRTKTNGFEIAGTVYLDGKRRFGLTADSSAHFADETQTFLATPTRLKIKDYNILGGVTYKLRSTSRAEPFVHALFGTTLIRHDVAIQTTPVNRFKNNYSGFAMALGGGLDVRVNRRFAFRAFQIDYNPIFPKDNRLTDGSSNQIQFGRRRSDEIRFSTGVVFR